MIVKWRLPTYLRQDQVRDFFSVITSLRDKALFSLIYLYGVRVSEACLLHRDDIDLRRRTIRIWRVKNGYSGEKPLFRRLVPILRRYLRTRIDDNAALFVGKGVGRMRTRIDVSRARGFSRFVGRQSEMAALEAALERAISGNAQVVGVVADAGTGKSRLCYEFAEHCRAREIKVYEAHGVAHGKAVPWSPILAFVRGYFGITEQDSPEAARRGFPLFGRA